MFQNEKKLTVMQGTYTVSTEPNVVLSTVLGSCVAVCAYDELAGIGGMNHILLPGTGEHTDGQSMLYGANLMELLLNDLFSKGARRKQLKFKIFGGANLHESSLNVGSQNIDFISMYVEEERLDVISSSLNGSLGRQIEFQPVTGRTRQKFLMKPSIDETHKPLPKNSLNAGELDLF